MDHEFPIENCPQAHAGEDGCPGQWDNLKPGFVAGARECGTCRRLVYLCRTEQDVALYTSLKYRIALAVGEIETTQTSDLPSRFFGAGSINRRQPRPAWAGEFAPSESRRRSDAA